MAGSRDDPERFALFYEALAPVVFRFFSTRTRDGQAALDLTAETFAKAFEKREAFRGHTEQEAQGWLWAIARHELTHYWRTKQTAFHAIHSLGLTRILLTDEELERIDELVSLTVPSQNLENALALLSAEHREVIRLKVIEDLDYRDIALRLGVTNDVVRARLSRGLRTPRHTLACGPPRE